MVFAFLALFILIVEQPGDLFSFRKGERLFASGLIPADVGKIEIRNPKSPDMTVILEKQEGIWRVVNGRFFPANQERLDEFLKMLHELKEGIVVSKNADRLSVFGLDETSAPQVVVTDQKGNLLIDFYIGSTPSFGHQYLRKNKTSEILEVVQSFNAYAYGSREDWKDKTFLKIIEDQVRRVALKDPKEEKILEKDAVSKEWSMTQPESYKADSLAVRTLFDQLKTLRAEAFAETEEGSQADFNQPDYKLSIRLNDDSLKLVLFKKAKEEGKYLVKNADTDLIYKVSSSLLDNIFKLEFKPKKAE